MRISSVLLAVTCWVLFSGAAAADEPGSDDLDSLGSATQERAAQESATPAATEEDSGFFSGITSTLSAVPSLLKMSGRKVSYFDVMGAYTLGDNSRGLADTAYGASAIYGTTYQSGLGFELHAFGDVFETETPNFTDYYRPGLGLDLTLSFGDREEFTLFALAGGGGVYNDVVPDNLDEFNFFVNTGFGVVTPPLTDTGLALRAEARAVYDFKDQFPNNSKGQYLDYRLALGIEIPLFHRVEMPATADGSVRVVQLVREVPTGLYDSDGDGVVDGSDQCPETPANTRVDGRGCPLPKVIQLKGVTFEFNEDRLTANAKTVLDALVVPLMRRYPDMVVEVAGHTDWIGNDAYNQNLSERRAQAVVAYLIESGIASANMTAAGYGEKEPIATNDTDEGRELNRRVELRIKN